MTDEFRPLIEALCRAEVDFILIGGLAAILHGAERSTGDVDVVYRRTPINLERIVGALTPFKPYLRGAPPGLPFLFDAETLRRGLNFTFTTEIGSIDFLGEVVGGGNYEALLLHSDEVRIHGYRCHVVGLRKLVELKRAAGRPKDFEAIAELEAVIEEKANSSRGGRPE